MANTLFSSLFILALATWLVYWAARAASFLFRVVLALVYAAMSWGQDGPAHHGASGTYSHGMPAPAPGQHFSDYTPSGRGSRYPDDWSQRRQAVLAAARVWDGYQCHDCGQVFPDGLEVHHRTRTGVKEHALANLEAVCHECHAAKGPDHAWIRAKILLRRDAAGKLHSASCAFGGGGREFRDTVSRAARQNGHQGLCYLCFAGRTPQAIDKGNLTL
jgi:hypothetical protein